ncbi:MAG: exonuclease domain-containing protein [Terrimicrobiaceae bacterium]
MFDFTVIDVETANPDFASICQIGVAKYSDGKIIDSWETLINPEDEFDDVNVDIHGITESMVSGAPTFGQAAKRLQEMISNTVVATYSHFDRVAINDALYLSDLPPIECKWLDVARVSRRAWPQFAQSGYNLANVTSTLGITFKHHNALEDAKAAGEVLLRAITETQLSPDEWVVRVTKPINPNETGSRVRQAGNSDGPLAGEVIIFTGALAMPRKQAASLAAQAGCDVKDAFGKTITILVVGDQDIRKLNGKAKSSKHQKAEEAIAQGQQVRIVCEKDFKRLIGIDVDRSGEG